MERGRGEGKRESSEKKEEKGRVVRKRRKEKEEERGRVVRKRRKKGE